MGNVVVSIGGNYKNGEMMSLEDQIAFINSTKIMMNILYKPEIIINHYGVGTWNGVKEPSVVLLGINTDGPTETSTVLEIAWKALAEGFNQEKIAVQYGEVQLFG